MELKLNDVAAYIDPEDLICDITESNQFGAWVDDRIEERLPDTTDWSEEDIAVIAQREVRDAADEADDDHVTRDSLVGVLADVLVEQLASMPDDPDRRCALGRAFTRGVEQVVLNSDLVRETVAQIVNERLAMRDVLAEVDAAEAQADADDGLPTVAEVDARVVDEAFNVALMTGRDDREVIDIMSDTAASLTWRVAAERELHRRGYRTHDADGAWLAVPEPPARIVVNVSVVTLPPNGEAAAATLHHVAEWFNEAGDVGPGDGGTVYDAFGNAVGTWHVAPGSNPDAS